MTEATTFKIELDSILKWRNKAEYRYVQRAKCGEHEVVGDGFIIRDLCRILAEQKGDIDGMVEVYRGATKVFTKAPLKSWVKTNPFSGEQPEQFRKPNQGEYK